MLKSSVSSKRRVVRSVIRGRGLGQGRVGDDLPDRWRGDLNRIAALDVRLVEAREEPVCLVRLEVGVDVLLAVLWIDEAMEAVAGRVVVVLVLDPDGHVRGHQPGGQGQPIAVPLGLNLASVDLEPLDGAAAEIEEERAIALGGERDRHVAAIRRATGDQVELDLVVGFTDASCTIGSFLLRQHVARLSRQRWCVWHFSSRSEGLGTAKRRAARSVTPARGVRAM